MPATADPKRHHRWALRVDATRLSRAFLLGRYCWKDGNEEEVPTRTFRTRQLAREAKKTCCYKRAKVVKVVVTIQEVT